MKDAKMTVAAGVLVTLCALIGFTAVATAAKKDASRKSSESTVTTNENGSVSRVFTECTVSTNGNMVTERRRETRTTMDTAGNVLESSTSEYAQSYSAGDTGVTPLSATLNAPGDTAAANAESFLGLKFGETFAGTNFVSDADEPTLTFAAQVAALYSAGDQAGKTAVDLTRARYVKKIPGAGPGMVTYTNQTTLYVTPDRETVEKYRVK
jgi:hypothetical protein